MISAQHRSLQMLCSDSLHRRRTEGFDTMLPALDALAPGHVFARGAVHELLWNEAQQAPYRLAAVLARAALRERAGSIIWFDMDRTFYPPALADMGIDLRRVMILHPADRVDAVWALGECLRCQRVDAVVAEMGDLSGIEARRLQLAAETGGTAGILLRGSWLRRSAYAAATRWQVCPARGSPQVQRWEVQLVHGHGGQVGQCAYLEFCRETNHVRAVAQLADQPFAANSRATA